MRKSLVFLNVVVAAILVGSVTLITRSRAVAAPAAAPTITFGHWSAEVAETNAVRSLLKSFTNKYHIRVNDQTLNGDYTTAIKARLTSGSAPDVMYVNSDVAQEFIRSGQLKSLDFLAKDKKFGLNKFWPSLVAGFKRGGHLYGIPKDYSTLALEYNKSLFSAAGIKKPPTTWGALQTDACKLTDKSKKRYGIAFNNDWARWLPYVYAAGGPPLLNKSGTKATLNTPAAKKALDFYAGLVKRGCAARPDQVGAGWSGEAFGRENVAMAMEGNWITGYMKAQFPSINWALAPLPKGPKREGNLAFTAAYAMWSKSSHPKEANTLLKYLGSKAGEQAWERYSKFIPSRKDVKAPPGTQVFVKGVKHSNPWFFPPGFIRAQDPINNDIRKVMEGSMSSSAALKDMQSQANAALSSP